RQADAGVMITASHNPPEYNGMKCLSKTGRGFSPEEDLALEKIYFGDLKPKAKKGKRLNDAGASQRYRTHIVQYVKKIFPVTPLKIVVDGGGGSASTVTPETLEALGFEVVRFNCKYDGMFRERNPEPTDANLEKLKSLVVKEGASLGVAHDGDGDRTAFV
ncbi:MAG: phosphoglucosamine mutase, partial [Candidatus Methanoperedens sp.]|nr:phosphoglucosamine mutase [Candidatus Methanoperedens sp.]